MLELMDLVLLGIVSCIISAFVCILAALVSHTIRNRDVNVLSKKVESLEMAYRGGIGTSKREEQAARAEEAMAKAVMLIKEGKAPIEAIKEVAVAYPDVAMKMAKKFGIGL